MRTLLALITAGTLLGNISATAAADVQNSDVYLTRAEAAVLLIYAARIPVDPDMPGAYGDVLPGQWYTAAMLAAAQRGILDSEASTALLYPHRSVSRAEFLKMMTVALDLSTNIPFRYSDIPRNAWFRPYAGIADRYDLWRDATQPLLLRPDLRLSRMEAIGALTTVAASVPDARGTDAAELSALLQRDAVPAPASTPSESVSFSLSAPEPNATMATPLRVKESMRRTLLRAPTGAAATKLDIVLRVNALRQAENLPTLTNNAQLEAAAQAHAQDLWTRAYFSHISPEGKSYIDRIRAAHYMDGAYVGCACQAVFTLDAASSHETSVQQQTACECPVRFGVGENIARGQLTAEQVIADWMASPSHRRTLLDPSFRDIGVGIFRDVWVQNFGHVEPVQKP